MSLFSWFNQKSLSSSKRDDKAAIKRELETFNNNIMWPIAKVRTTTTIKQQQYINGVQDKALNSKATLRERSL